MNSNTAIFTSLVGMLGVMLGASLQFYFARRTEAFKQFQANKAQAYIDFVRAVSGRSIAQKHHNKEKEFEFTSLLADAKTRIAVYGSKDVVSTVASFFRDHGSLNKPESMEVFIKVIQTMRIHTIKENGGVTDKDIESLLFL
ncbi:MAG: hypothetical protein ACREEM_01475 [Blastocatellia bacterium]